MFSFSFVTVVCWLWLSKIEPKALYMVVKGSATELHL